MSLHRQMDTQPDMQMHNELLGASLAVWNAVKSRAEPLRRLADGVVILLFASYICRI